MENWKKPWKSIHPKISLMIFCRLQRRRFWTVMQNKIFFWNQPLVPPSEDNGVILKKWLPHCQFGYLHQVSCGSGGSCSTSIRVDEVRFNTPNLYEIKFGFWKSMKILLLLVVFLQAFCQLTKTKDFFQSFWQKSLHSTLYGLQDLKPFSNARRVTCTTPRSRKQHARLTDSPQQKQA